MQAEPDRVGLDLELGGHAADARHLGDARDRGELRLDVPVLDRPEAAEVDDPAPSTVYQKIWPVAGPSGRAGGSRPAGSGPSASKAESRSDRLLRAVGTSTESSKITQSVEAPKSLDERIDLHAPDAVQFQAERGGDLIFDLGGAVAGPLGMDDDLVLGQVRDRVHGRDPCGIGAPRSAMTRVASTTRIRFRIDQPMIRSITDVPPHRRGAASPGICPASASTAAVQPSQQRNTSRPRTATFGGTPIEPSGLPVTGQIFWRRARGRSAAASPCSQPSSARPASPRGGPVAARGPRPGAEVAGGEARVQSGLGVDEEGPLDGDPIAGLQPGDDRERSPQRGPSVTALASNIPAPVST